MNWRSNSIAKSNAPALESPMTGDARSTILKKRVETRRMIEDEREAASRNRADSLDWEIMVYERAHKI